MTARRNSLSRRLLLAAAGFIAAALVVAAILIGFVLHRFIQGQIDQRLDTQIVFLTSMLRTGNDGKLTLAGDANGPPFERPRRGWYWQIVGPNNAIRSTSLEGGALEMPELNKPPRPPPPGKDGERAERPRPYDGPGPEDERLHFRIKDVVINGVTATVMTSAPRDAVLRPLREAMTTLALSLLALGVALIAAMLLQIRLGLRPLESLRHAISDVRAGRAAHVPSDQPAEVQPLVGELNALLAENDANLERARRHVANLAHGLKTPLATLAIALSEREARDVTMLPPLVTAMERRIRHHLGRARVAALAGGSIRARTEIAPRLRDLCGALAKIHADKPLTVALDVSEAATVACEQQDFDEMAGNLMENAFKWSRGRISVASRTRNRTIDLVIEDDGPGLQPEDVVHVLRPGERLDETSPGFGFGLSITRELAELYGGGLQLDRGDLGGLRAILQLPAAAL